MNPPLLDHHQLATFADIGYVDYIDILGDVIRDVPGHLDRIRTAVHQEDSEQLRGSVHSFRGMLSYFGCIVLTTRLAELETHPVLPSAQAATLQAELGTLWDQSLAAIKEWEKSVPGFVPGS